MRMRMVALVNVLVVETYTCFNTSAVHCTKYGNKIHHQINITLINSSIDPIQRQLIKCYMTKWRYLVDVYTKRILHGSKMAAKLISCMSA